MGFITSMITRETKDSFIFITQHEHATISGEFFVNLKKEFIPTEHFESLKFAIYQHDRAWIIPDSEPIWNDKLQKPYDFIAYPENIKLHFYKLGIEQVDQANSYAALLCSMHYSSFFAHSETEYGKSFYERETLRQKHLMQRLRIQTSTFLNYQLKILQLCDDLSLYACMNNPGVDKKNEHPLFKDGFNNSEFFHDNGEQRVTANYQDKHIIKFNSRLFEKPFEIKITFKKILKDNIQNEGLLAAFTKQPWFYHTVKII